MYVFKGLGTGPATSLAAPMVNNPTVPMISMVPQLPSTTPMVPVPGGYPGSVAEPWYKTPIGMIGIGVALFAGYHLFIAKKAA